MFADAKGKNELENIAGLEIIVDGHDKQIVIDASKAQIKEKTNIYFQVCALQPDPGFVQTFIDQMALHQPELLNSIKECIDNSDEISEEILNVLQAVLDAILNGKV